MRFYRGIHQHYCGVDLHARAMHVCLMDQQGTLLVDEGIRCEPEEFLRRVAPYQQDLVVTAECIFCWYWLADLCAQHGITFVLAHALYLKAIHGAKAKNDALDAAKLVTLLRGGVIPRPTCTRRACAPRATSCAAVSTSCASGPNCSRTSRTRFTSTT